MSGRSRILNEVDSELIHDFEVATAGGDQDVDLFGAAMIIARLGDPAADSHAVARELDLIAEAVLDATGDAHGAQHLAAAINHELFSVRGFHGNAKQYSEPENSFLDQVLVRRTGLPIALSLLYMEVAQRVGLRCDGVGYPGHFIVRCGEPPDVFFLDPFNGGERLPEADLLRVLDGQHLGGASRESFLAAITRRQVLQRMLRNLHVVYRERRDFERWLGVLELSIVLEPWNAALVGERGMLHYRMGDAPRALEDLQQYASAVAPDAISAGALRLLDQLRLQFGGREEPRP
jgi:regulator of sirC expression with transglutaminase-like and TPR domain